MDSENTLLMKTMKGTTMGLVGGTILGVLSATWHDESNRVLPRLPMNVKLVGTYGLTLAAIGGVYYAVEHLAQHCPVENFLLNGPAAAFVGGAMLCRSKGRSTNALSMVQTGSSFAFICALINVGRSTTKNGIGSSVEKKPPVC